MKNIKTRDIDIKQNSLGSHVLVSSHNHHPSLDDMKLHAIKTNKKNISNYHGETQSNWFVDFIIYMNCQMMQSVLIEILF